MLSGTLLGGFCVVGGSGVDILFYVTSREDVWMVAAKRLKECNRHR